MNDKEIYRVVETKGFKKSLLADGNLEVYLPAIQEFVDSLRYEVFQNEVERMKTTKNLYKKRFGNPWRLLFTVDKKSKLVELLKVVKRENAY
ncbi:hypothetical protein CDAR_101641 [Caerostris darwini]|uniref:LAGLIDADG homing endonuclease n=1 Tax=Caerostris darwini TaxID=1538125 RepID=A0AAV4SQ50_9ARAC|nr:hypothetical protein CDAR_101641 [Caerostris darwini]